MSKPSLQAIAMRFMEDESFRKKLDNDPHAALAEYDLTAEEKAAIMRRDEQKLITLGLDERIVKGSLN